MGNGNRKYQRYLRSKNWRQKRKEAIERYGRICSVTGLPLLPNEINVHHWHYGDNLYETPVSDLCVVSKAAHEAIHQWVRTEKLVLEAISGGENAKLLYLNWVSLGMPDSLKVFRRLKAWIRKKEKALLKTGKPAKGKKASVIRGQRGFPQPKKIYETMSQQERHRLILNS